MGIKGLGDLSDSESGSRLTTNNVWRGPEGSIGESSSSGRRSRADERGGPELEYDEEVVNATEEVPVEDP